MIIAAVRGCCDEAQSELLMEGPRLASLLARTDKGNISSFSPKPGRWASYHHYPSMTDEETEGESGQATFSVCSDLGSGWPYLQLWAVSGGHGFSASWGKGSGN